jgi:hypothetical protein
MYYKFDNYSRDYIPSNIPIYLLKISFQCRKYAICSIYERSQLPIFGSSVKCIVLCCILKII